MLMNKWISFGLNIAIGVLGLLVTADWSSVVSAPLAGKILVGLGLVKAGLNMAQPSASQTIVSTGNTLFTHT